MWKDLAFILRTLRRSPTFTGVAVISLALGIGANTAIFSLLDQVLLRSLPVRDPQRLVVFHTDYTAPGSSTRDNPEAVFSYPMYRQLRDRDPAFDSVIARSGAKVTLRHQGNAEPAAAEMVSGNFFHSLGVGAALGRVLTPDDDGAPGAHPVVVLGHGFWSTRFGNSPEILNQTVTLNGHPVVVVGVVAARFHGLVPGSTPDLFVPIAMKRVVTPTWDGLEDAHIRWLDIFARLKPGFTMGRAQAATGIVYHSILEAELAGMGKMRSDRARDEFLNHRVELRPAVQGINGLRRQWEKPLVALMAMVGMVLLIACVNVAGLMLARASGRQREIAIRLAIGAPRWVLVRQLLLEGLMLAMAGGLLGLLVAMWSTDALIRLLPRDDTGGWLVAALDFRLLGFTVALSTASGLLFSVIPALRATRADLAATLKNQAANVASGTGLLRFRQLIVTAQVALSLLMVVGAGLFTSSLIHLTRVNLGFRTERLLLFSVDAGLTRPEQADAMAFYRDLQERLSAIGNVAGVGVADAGPFSGNQRGTNIMIEGYQPKEDESLGGAMDSVGPGFFRALGVPLRAGREFTGRDNAAAPKVAVVNEAFAKRYFGGQNPVGRRFMLGDSNHPVFDREIVGMVADCREGVRERAPVTFYFPYEQRWSADRMTFYVRTAEYDQRIAAQIRQVVRSADANVPVSNLDWMTVRVNESIYSDRLIAMLAVAFGVLATLLAAIGLYGVVANAVARRTAEIGVRLALGAQPSDVLRMVLKEAGRLVAGGIAIGIAGAFALSRVMASQLFGVKAYDPAIFAGAAALLAVVALAAAFVPGWKASRIDPVSALKYE